MKMKDVFGAEPVFPFELFVLETDQKQDAAAHAINCHDDLVEALEAARQEIVASAMADQRNDAGFSTDSALWAKRAMDRIDAALTKAKGA